MDYLGTIKIECNSVRKVTFFFESCNGRVYTSYPYHFINETMGYENINRHFIVPEVTRFTHKHRDICGNYVCHGYSSIEPTQTFIAKIPFHLFGIDIFSSNFMHIYYIHIDYSQNMLSIIV